MAKKKAPQGKSMLEQLSDWQPPWEDEPEGKKDADPNAGLVERLAKLEAENEAFRRQQAYQGFTRTQAEPTKTQVTGPAELNLDGLPDPVSNPKEHAIELTKRQRAIWQAELDARDAQRNQVDEQKKLAEQVWNGYKSVQPEWSKHEMLVQAAAAKISNDMVAKGVDMVSLLRQQPDLFYSEVTNLLDKQYPQLKGEGKEEGNDDDDAGRTAGVFGGTPGKQSGGGEEAVPGQEDNEAFLRSLAEVRYKAGVR